MRAFVSYSVNDQDQYILSLLSKELRDRNFTLSQSSDFNSEMSSVTKVSINKSDLFIGIITDESQETDRVINEWSLATTCSIPAILMIEDSVELDISFSSLSIRFNRSNPDLAIKELNQKTSELNKTKDSDSSVWAVAAAVAVIAIIIGIIASSSKGKK